MVIFFKQKKLLFHRNEIGYWHDNQEATMEFG